MSTEVTTTRQGMDLSPQTFEQALTFSQYLADSDMVPKDFKGKPGNCLIAMQWGAEVGLKPLQSLQNIAVINGRPALWGDSVIALVRSSPVCEYIVETQNEKEATCKVKRRGEPEQTRTFSLDDARDAGLLGKQGPWTQYRKRMMQMRARAFAMRDVFPDVLKGMPIAEEVMDIPSGEVKHMGMAEVVQPEEKSLPSYDDAKFSHNLKGSWQKRVNEGGNINDLLTMLKTRNALTAEQEAAILALKPLIENETPITAEQIEQKLKDAKDVDALYVAADLISAIKDADALARLDAVFQERLAALGETK